MVAALLHRFAVRFTLSFATKRPIREPLGVV